MFSFAGGNHPKLPSNYGLYIHLYAGGYYLYTDIFFDYLNFDIYSRVFFDVSWREWNKFTNH